VSYFLVVFSSRTETVKFANILSSYGHQAAFVNTPRQISASCGISAKIQNAALKTARNILMRRQFYTFAGIYFFSNNEYVKF